MARRTRILCTLTAALIAAGALPDQADAGRRGKGRAARSGSAEARSGSVHREITRTGPGGETRTRQKDTTWQRGGGRATRDTTWTGPNGKTATRHSEVQRTEDGFDRTTSVTRPNGSTTSRSTSVSRTPGSEGASSADASPAE